MRSLLLVFLLISSSAGWAGTKNELELENLITQLGAETHPDRAQASEKIRALAKEDLEVVSATLLVRSRVTLEPEIRRQTRQLLESIYSRYVLGRGDVDFGMELGWYLDDNGKRISTLPYVLEVKSSGPAEEGGMKEGDVIVSVDGKTFRSLDARKDLMRCLAKRPVGKAVKFKVRNNPSTTGACHLYHRHKKRDLEVLPILVGEVSADEEFPMGRFRGWLDALPIEGL
jgi:C-terminal processing protease CtpA/Prc